MRIKFLDYEIVDTGNSDGTVLCKNNLSLANFKSGEEGVSAAKKYATVLYMVERPKIFAPHNASRILYGLGRSHEWFLFEKSVKADGLKMPKELSSSDDLNFGIRFNGERLGLSPVD